MLDRLRRRPSPTPPLPLDGWPPGPSSPIDDLSDESLAALNALLPWQCFTADGRGRRFGHRAWSGKREEPQPIPDRRITLMDERFGLRGVSVLELGCFEGIHTIGLCRVGASVTALDARAENVAKTAVRAAMYGCAPTLLVRDLERPDALDSIEADLAHHVGVLYHLDDPVTHLVELGQTVGGVMLDTHVTDRPRATYEVDGSLFEYAPYAEHGRADVFSGMRPESKWLTVDALRRALELADFRIIEIVEDRLERNGRRVLIFASRATMASS